MPLYEQVQAALKIRNCLAHASGMLAWFHEEKELRRIQSRATYFSREHRNRQIAKDGTFDEILITQSAMGDRLEVKNEYSFVVSSYLREYFVALCGAAKERLGA